MLQAQNKLEEAEVCFRQVIKLKPEAANAHNNLGNMLQAQVLNLKKLKFAIVKP
ncbi:hypothetical protein BGP_6558 [Beggiatoa sp. PS]|nr:hypothetical protein BGP_6558 [Beggiatoa sp. PS]